MKRLRASDEDEAEDAGKLKRLIITDAEPLQTVGRDEDAFDLVAFKMQ